MNSTMKTLTAEFAPAFASVALLPALELSAIWKGYLRNVVKRSGGTGMNAVRKMASASRRRILPRIDCQSYNRSQGDATGTATSGVATVAATAASVGVHAISSNCMLKPLKCLRICCCWYSASAWVS